PAIKKRRGIEGQNLKESDEIWLIEADYLAQALLDYTLILSPEKIILGGGVMKQDHLIKKIHVSLNKQLNGYVQLPPMEDYVVGCELKDDSGTYGCLLLAKEEAR
ncbi:ROK family protein, partial [Melissococcus plutonius]